MSDSRRIAGRVARNTLMLYFRQILIMLVSLYTVRVVLSVLGAEDYGIYNVVAGVVTMFGFLSGAMATASQRYFSFDLGKNDAEHLKTTFSVTFQIYVLLALVIVLLAETAGLWFVNHKLVIPAERMTAANWIFQAAVASFLLTLITTPYMACIIAHENMNVYAYVSIVEAALKLGIVFLLRVLPYDKLVVYGFLLAAVAFVNTSLYRFYCRTHYAECRFRFVKDGALFKEIVGYSGWNLFGAVAAVLKVQVMNILLNLFFGVLVNAARSVASSVNAAVTSFASNFSQSLNPQIVKSYAAGETERMLFLMFRGCKFVFFLMFVFILPLVLEMDAVLSLWLKNPPEYAVTFTRLALLDPLAESITLPLITAIEATGNIKLYKGLCGGILLLNLPLSWLFLHFGARAEVVMVIAICLTFAASVARVLLCSHYLRFSVITFLRSVVVRCGCVFILSSVPSYFVHRAIGGSTPMAFCSVLAAVAIVSLCTVFFGFSEADRTSAVSLIKEKISRGTK